MLIVQLLLKTDTESSISLMYTSFGIGSEPHPDPKT
jgi:hypothetical protein